MIAACLGGGAIAAENSVGCPESRSLVKILDRYPAVRGGWTKSKHAAELFRRDILQVSKAVDSIRRPRLTALYVIVVSLALVIRQNPVGAFKRLQINCMQTAITLPTI